MASALDSGPISPSSSPVLFQCVVFLCRTLHENNHQSDESQAFPFLCDFRRFIWNFFRLENEHLNNCGQFRAVRDISVVPMETNDQAFLEQMMDDMDGLALTKRRGQQKRKTSVVLRSLRKMSSKGEGVSLRKDATIVIENETETSL